MQWGNKTIVEHFFYRRDINGPQLYKKFSALIIRYLHIKITTDIPVMVVWETNKIMILRLCYSGGLCKLLDGKQLYQ